MFLIAFGGEYHPKHSDVGIMRITHDGKWEI